MTPPACWQRRGHGALPGLRTHCPPLLTRRLTRSRVQSHPSQVTSRDDCRGAGAAEGADEGGGGEADCGSAGGRHSLARPSMSKAALVECRCIHHQDPFQCNQIGWRPRGSAGDLAAP